MKSQPEQVPQDMADKLAQLADKGYACRYPMANLRPLRADGTGSEGAVYLEREGPWPQWIYLERGTWLVLIVGEKTDYQFEDFLTLCDGGWITPKVAAMPGQRSLFGDE
jgi:hypothetical protein